MKNKKLILLLAAVMVIAFAVASCSESGSYDDEEQSGTEARLNAIETSYQVVKDSEEYNDVDYVFPKIEGMTNLSKQADANGNLKRFGTKATKDNSGERGPISNDYEVMIANDYLLSVVFPTTLDVDIATRSCIMLVREHKFMYTIENLVGRATDFPENFAATRAVFEAAGASADQTDDDFRKNLIYFKGEDMKNLELHMTYWDGEGKDIVIPFNDITDYLKEDVAEMMDFAIQ